MSSAANDGSRVLYLDASAITKLIVEEAETPLLTRAIGTARLAASEIVEVEVPRAILASTGSALGAADAMQFVERLELVELTPDLRRIAAVVGPPRLRSLDAIHLASMLKLTGSIEAAVIYDRRLGTAAREAGVRVLAPGYDA